MEEFLFSQEEFLMRIWLAIRVFFRVLFSRAVAERVGRALEDLRQMRREGPVGPESPEAEATPETGPPTTKSPLKGPAKPAAKTAVRSEALTLLAALQREARLVDLIQEPLDQYTDAQIGAAARDVLRNAAKTLDRFFSLRPVVQAEEGAVVETPRDFDPNRYRLIGHVAGQPPYRGRLVHPGWEADRCELPTWSGPESAAHVIAPAELEIEPS